MQWLEIVLEMATFFVFSKVLEENFDCAKFNNASRNNWKSLFEVNFSKNSTKTIRLCAVDSWFGHRPHQLSPYRNLELII